MTTRPLPTTASMTEFAAMDTVAPSGLLDRNLLVPLVAVLSGMGALLAAEIACALLLTHGHLIYALEAAYTDLALAQQIVHGNYGLVAGEASAPSSSILYPFLLAGLSPLGLGAALPLAINALSTLAAGAFAILIAVECRIPLHEVAWPRLFILAAVVALALNLPGLAFTGLEHSLHVAMTVAYLLGLVRFVQRGRADWWWFLCIIIQPIVRFEAAGMLVADALIFISFRKYGYAVAMLAIGVVLVGGYSLFLSSLGLPLLPSSVLARSDWSNAAVSSHGGLVAVISAVLKNTYSNLNSFGAAQMLGGVALGAAWLGGAWSALRRGPVTSASRLTLATLAFMSFVTVAQIAGGKLGWVPPRYEAYVLALNLCGLAIIYRDRVTDWCSHATWPRVSAISLALLLVFAGYVTQFLAIPAMAQKEYLGPYQLHRFVADYYRAPIAIDQIGYLNFDNPSYVLDLSGLSSEAARRARARTDTPDWMDSLLAQHGVGLAIVDSMLDPDVPAAWTAVAQLGSEGTAARAHRFIFYARRPADVAAINAALDRFAPTLAPAIQLHRVNAAPPGSHAS